MPKSRLLRSMLGRYRVAEGRGTRERGVQLPCVCTEHEMAKIPSRTFPGLPNLRRLDLSQNKLDARGLHPCAFKVCSTLLLVLPGGGPAGLRWLQAATVPLPTLPGVIRPGGGAVQTTQHGGLQ